MSVPLSVAQDALTAGAYDLQSRCLELLSNPDLEWVTDRLLADLTDVAAAQSAALWLADERARLFLRAYRGLWERHTLPERLELPSAIASHLSEGAPWTEGEGAKRTLCLPLVGGGEVLGLVQLADPLRGGFAEERLGDLRTLADFGAVAVRHGRKILALQRLGLRDRETAAYNLSYFTDYASKEIYKARRYGRTFSLLVFSLDGALASGHKRPGTERAREVIRGAIRSISRIVRDSDVIAKASEHEFYVMLPETDFFGALMFARRAAVAVREDSQMQLLEAELPIGMTFGASTFPKDGDDFDDLLHTCRRRMEERRGSLQRKLLLDGLSFWEEVRSILESPPRATGDEFSEPSRWGSAVEGLFYEVQREIAREVQRDPSARGLLFVGSPEVRSDLPLVSELENPPADLAARLYVLGRRADLHSHPALTPVFIEGDERMSRHAFILWLSEHSAYALLLRAGMGQRWGFHTADAAVVDDLIAKLQVEYDLQPY